MISNAVLKLWGCKKADFTRFVKERQMEQIVANAPKRSHRDVLHFWRCSTSVSCCSTREISSVYGNPTLAQAASQLGEDVGNGWRSFVYYSIDPVYSKLFKAMGFQACARYMGNHGSVVEVLVLNVGGDYPEEDVGKDFDDNEYDEEYDEPGEEW